MDPGVEALFGRIKERQRMQRLSRPLEVVYVPADSDLEEETAQAWQDMPCADGRSPVLRAFASLSVSICCTEA
eukprot:gene6496-3134_t